MFPSLRRSVVSRLERSTRRTRRRLRLESLEDRAVPATFTVTNTDDSGTGSLRQAIIDANTTVNGPDADTIAFNILGGVVHTIQPLTPLDSITEAVVIDGYTQSGASPNTLSTGNNAVLRIELHGGGLGSPGLTLAGAGGSTVRGLVINNFNGDGISIASDSNKVLGNYIGTDVTGTSDVGNTKSGVLITDGVVVDGSLNIVGGDSPADRNRIAFNGLDGVRVAGFFAFNNSIQGNEILDNDGLGIDLNGDGVTANDANDFDFGPNGLQNFPVLTSAVSDEQRTTIKGSLQSFPFNTYTLRFYSSPTADASGNGEGAVYLGSQTIRVDLSGVSNFKLVLPVDIKAGDVVSATATDSGGSTSEFSNALVVTAGLHPTLLTLDAIILDLDGDGIDVTGTTTTTLLNGQPEIVRWTKGGTDDAFLLVDASSLRSAGFIVMDHRGDELTSPTLFRDGLRIKSPSGKETIVQDGWQMLGLFDSNKDGKVNSSDPVWQHLKLYVDQNGDGAIQAGEVQDVPPTLQGLVVPLDPVGSTDNNGSRNENWFFEGGGSITRTISNVWFAQAGGGSTAPRVFNWTGLSSSDWYDAANWDLNDVPSMVDTAIVSGGVADHGAHNDYVGRLYMYGGTVRGSGEGEFTVSRLHITAGDLDGDGTTEIPVGGSLIFRGDEVKRVNNHQLRGSGIATGRRQYQPLLLDLNGDGLDLTGRAPTALLTWGTGLAFRWTKANTDDAFLVVDADDLRAATGEDLTDYDGAPIADDVLFASGLRLRSPDGQDRIITDGWQLLAAFDKNNDGKIDANDPVFNHLKLFVDTNADGAMSPGELTAMSSSAPESIALNPGRRRDADGAGNTQIHGSFTKSSGETGLMSDVHFGSIGRIDVPIVLDGSGTFDPNGGAFLMDTGTNVGFSGDGKFHNNGRVQVKWGSMHVEDGRSTGVWDLDNDGVLEVAGDFEFAAGTVFTSRGLLSVDPAGSGRGFFIDDIDVSLGRVDVATDGAIGVGSNAAITIDGGSIKGEITADAGSTVTLSGNLELGSGAMLTGSGNFIVGNDAPEICDVVVTGSSHVSNLTVSTNGRLSVIGNLVAISPVLVENAAYVKGVTTAREHGSGLATGRITGNVINDSGTLDVVLLTIDGDYTQKQDATLRLPFGISEPGLPGNGQLTVTGHVSLDGRLILSEPVGFSAAPGTSFTLIKYDSVTGTFDRIDGLDLGASELSVFGFSPQEINAQSRAANPGNTFTDADGDIFTVKLIGPGRASVFLDDPDSDGKGPIQHIHLTGTNGRTSKLFVTVVKPKGAVSDGMVSIGSIEGSGIGGIMAPKSNLIGSFGHGIELTGALGGLSIRDVLNGTDVLAGGEPAQATFVIAHVLDKGTTIDLGTSISSFTAAKVSEGTIRAPRIGVLRVIGDRVGPIAGDFSGTVTVTGSSPIGLGIVSISGAVTNGHFNVLSGRVGTFSVGSFVDSSLFAGYVPTDSKQPMSGGGFTTAMWIKLFKVKGTFAGSFVAADSIFTATIGNVITDNGPDAFGILAHTKFGVLYVTQPKLKLLQTNLPFVLDDFQVKLV